MRLLAARSEVAASGAMPQGFHSPPLAWAAVLTLVSSLHFSMVHYNTISRLVNGFLPSEPELSGKSPFVRFRQICYDDPSPWDRTGRCISLAVGCISEKG